MPIADVNGIGINYRVMGSGEPIVMVAGFGADLSSWSPQLAPFREHFRVVAFDNRGVGKSGTPPGPYSIKGMADDTVGLLDQLGIEKAHVMGISMGGMIAQEVAMNYPERVRKLVLCATFANQSAGSGTTDEFLAAPLSHGVGTMRDMIRFAFNNPLYRFFLLVMSRLSPQSASEVGAAGQRAAIDGHDALSRLHLIEAPTLVVVGTKDRLIRPSSSEVIAARIPNATLAKIEGGSHGLNMEYARQFNEIVLSFLTGD